MQYEPRPAIHMDKQLGWASKLGGVDSFVVSKTGCTVLPRLMLASLMAPACQLCGFVEGELRKGMMDSVCLDDRHSSFSQYATGAFQAATLVLELRGSEYE